MDGRRPPLLCRGCLGSSDSASEHYFYGQLFSSQGRPTSRAYSELLTTNSSCDEPARRLKNYSTTVWFISCYRTGSATQSQMCKCCSISSIYRPHFAGYISKSCPISARSSPDSSTSPACKFSKVRFMFLRSAHRSTTTGKTKKRSEGVSRILTKIWEVGLRGCQEHQPRQCSAARPWCLLRSAMVVRCSTGLRLSLIFFDWGSWERQLRRMGSKKNSLPPGNG